MALPEVNIPEWQDAVSILLAQVCSYGAMAS